MPGAKNHAALYGGGCRLSPRKTKNQTASVRQRLLNYAQSNAQDFLFVLRTFAIERLLFRLSHSLYADQFVLKGALLFRVWRGDFYRQTHDIDMFTYESQTAVSLKTIFKHVCQIPLVDDGLLYLPETIKVDEIREGQPYGGFRVTLNAMLGKANIHLQVDCGFGDAITPSPVRHDFPTILEFPSPRLQTYPKETMVAEKIEAIVRLGMANSRMKDFYDLWVMANDFSFSGQQITLAIKNTFKRRQTFILSGTPVAFQTSFIQNPTKQTQWQAFVKKTKLAEVEPDFKKTIDFIKVFLEPPLEAIANSKPFEMTWPSGGPWFE